MFVACYNVLFDFQNTELPLPGSDGRAMETDGLPVGAGVQPELYLTHCNSHFMEGRREACLALHGTVQ